MRLHYLKMGLMAVCMLSLWLMASLLEQDLSQKGLHKIASKLPGTCLCPEVSSRCGCVTMTRKCSTCLREPGQSLWFDKYFSRAIEPLMEPDMPMSTDALLLWMGLQSSSGMPLKNRKQKQHQTKVSSCKTCAVVGNSQLLQGSQYGSKINQHDVVLRMNGAPVQGFEVDVGNTTTMRIMYPENLSIQDPGIQLLVLPLNSSGLKWFLDTLREDIFFLKPKNPGFHIVQFPREKEESENEVLVISLSFLRYVHKEWLKNKGHFPSLGLVAVFYALHTCDQVSLFGLGTANPKSWVQYWDNKHWSMNTMHDLQAEYNLILQLQCEGKVLIYN